jgi:hypothetical protein
VPVSASVPVDVLDRLCHLAHQRGQTLSGIVRGILICSLREVPPDPPNAPAE